MIPFCVALFVCAHGLGNPDFVAYANWVSASSLSAIVGTAIFYKGKIPEKFSPGSFNYLGNSHLFHHVFGALCCYAGFAATPFIASFEKTIA
jgi:hypothetical protein